MVQGRRVGPRWLLALVAMALAGAASAQRTVSVPRADGQSVPLRVYAPESRACRGTALVSPGAGGSEKGYAYLGEALSASGYLTVVIGHAESGRRALREHSREGGLREGLSALTTDPRAYEARLMDIAAARHWAKDCPQGLSVLIGHSMGAATTMIEAGARNLLGLRGHQAFDAYIAMSPQGSGPIFPAKAWSDIRSPLLSLTGTRDGELGGASWRARTEPFEDMAGGCKWLGVIPDATHTHFAGHGFSAKTERVSVRVITAFLSAVQAGDCRRPSSLPGLDLQTK